MNDMPPIVAKLDGPESGPRPAPVRAMAAIVFRKGGGLELRPLQGCTAEEIAVIERVELVPWFHVEPEVIRNLIEPAGDGLAGKQ